MKSVKVDKARLLEILEKNRDKHVKEYNAAHEIFVTNAIVSLKKKINEINEGTFEGFHVNLPIPVNYEKEYDQAIGMLNMSVDDSIELSGEEYSRYVGDQWEWTQQHVMSNTRYLQ